jgi:hypothetical protein
MRLVCSLLLLAFLAGIPFVGIAPLQKSSGETIALLDVCSPNSPGSMDNINAIAEPVFDITAFLPVIHVPENPGIVLDLMVPSRIYRPPTV